MRLSSYLQSSSGILETYDGSIPFAAWLKNYFREHKKFGSRDRKAIADLCFCYYRLGAAAQIQSTEERLLMAQMLCHEQSAFITELKSDWKEFNTKPFKEKLAFFGLDEVSIFPFTNALSKEIGVPAFCRSHLQQPDVFLRARRNKRQMVMQKLKAAAVPFSMEDDCVRLPTATRVDELLALDKEAVVQDKSSQQCLNLLLKTGMPASFSAWDCCAASGGKSILLHDLFPKAQLTVSDIRESIIHNLRSRFKRAGITAHQSFVADVSSPSFSIDKMFDVIICDAPCSGSGTWGRTPEQLHFFLEERIQHYTSLQKRIAVNASKQLKEGGYFLYITCSVFGAENEDVVEEILKQTPLQLVEQTYYKGYAEKADTLFTALFSR